MAPSGTEGEKVVDRIWEFQLRRENAAILDRLEMLEEQNQVQQQAIGELVNRLQAQYDSRFASQRKVMEDQALALAALREYQASIASRVDRLCEPRGDLRKNAVDMHNEGQWCPKLPPQPPSYRCAHLLNSQSTWP
jgi:uncharacterized coiled-coil protein SlyX